MQRINGDSSICKRAVGACLTIVQFVGVQNHHLTRQRVAQCTSVIEALDTMGGQRQRIGVMTMWRISKPTETRFNPFDVTCGFFNPTICLQSQYRSIKLQYMALL